MYAMEQETSLVNANETGLKGKVCSETRSDKQIAHYRVGLAPYGNSLHLHESSVARCAHLLLHSSASAVASARHLAWRPRPLGSTLPTSTPILDLQDSSSDLEGLTASWKEMSLSFHHVQRTYYHQSPNGSNTIALSDVLYLYDTCFLAVSLICTSKPHRVNGSKLHRDSVMHC